MGTNFYLRKKLTLSQNQEIIDDLLYCRYDEIREKLPKDIHIGKRSYGWKFLWDANLFEHFEPNKKSIKEFLKSGQIIDEYGEKFSYDKFINEEVGDRIDNGYDAISWHKDHPEEYNYWFRNLSERERLIFLDKYNLDINQYGEFYIDELRFTVSQDFS